MEETFLCLSGKLKKMYKFCAHCISFKVHEQLIYNDEIAQKFQLKHIEWYCQNM